jgi:hypothetical protein
MTQTRRPTVEEATAVAVMIVPDAREQLSIEEIARAVGTHIEGQFHSLKHRYAEEMMRQQVQLETIHEAKDGRQFRVVTEYHEVFTIVDLVEVPTSH